ncbi:MAG: hypothetical protein HY735_12515 [Verrucomicrobia bacterium]|nr:hypothetical protein [Verrucomicrobiota bacterium]
MGALLEPTVRSRRGNEAEDVGETNIRLLTSAASVHGPNARLLGLEALHEPPDWSAGGSPASFSPWSEGAGEPPALRAHSRFTVPRHAPRAWRISMNRGAALRPGAKPALDRNGPGRRPALQPGSWSQGTRELLGGLHERLPRV